MAYAKPMLEKRTILATDLASCTPCDPDQNTLVKARVLFVEFGANAYCWKLTVDPIQQ